MPRLFVGNFDFEHQLAHPQFTPSRQHQRLNAELAPSWLALAEDGDLIFTPEPISDDFWDSLPAVGLPRVQPVTSLPDWKSRMGTADSSREWQIVPWGWSSRLIQDLHPRTSQASPQQSGPSIWLAASSPPPLAAVKEVNSRQFSATLEQNWGIGLPGAICVRSLSELTAGLDQMWPQFPRWVVKAEFGMSGRERRLGQGPLSELDCRWIERRLQADGVVFLEPWVECIAEYGVQYDIPPPTPAQPHPEVRRLGVTTMLPMRHGQYAGTIFQPLISSDGWDAALADTDRAIRAIQARGYWGPVGIDIMQYGLPSGEQRWRPLQDINARWTMGRLALGWRSKFPDHPFGAWWQGSIADWPAGAVGEMARRIWADGGNAPVDVQMIRTSPEQIGHAPSRHVSALIVARS